MSKSDKQIPTPRQLRFGVRDGIADGWAVGWNETLADLVSTRTSGLGVFYVLLYIALWTRYRDAMGEAPPSTRQISILTGVPNKTLDRYHDRFHAAFPELDDPASLVDVVMRGDVQIRQDDSPELIAFKLGGAQL